MQNLINQAAAVTEGYKSNKIIMDFVTNEAREKVASEIRAKQNGGTTAKAVALLELRYSNIKARVDEYINVGLVGCYMASLNA